MGRRRYRHAQLPISILAALGLEGGEPSEGTERKKRWRMAAIVLTGRPTDRPSLPTLLDRMPDIMPGRLSLLPTEARLVSSVFQMRTWGFSRNAMPLYIYNGWSPEIRTTLSSDFSSTLRHTEKLLWYHSETHSKFYRLIEYYGHHSKWTGAIEWHGTFVRLIVRQIIEIFTKRSRGRPNLRGWVLLHMPALGSNYRKCWFIC